DQELRVLGPAITALGEAHFILAERLSVRGGSILLVRRAVTDVAVQNDECRTSLRLAEASQRLLDAFEIVGIAHPQDVPPVPQESGGDVLGEGDARVPLDGDVVVVVDPAEVIEPEVPGERGRLRSHPLHQAAVTDYGVDVVIEDGKAGLVVTAGEPLAGDGHAHAGRSALPERTGGGLDARDPVIFGVPGRLALG